MARELRIGHGFDVHRFSKRRKLVLGGVKIPYTMGLIGHSDADVLLHALINALLGAIGEGDIGTHFPEGDPTYKNIASTKLLDKTLTLMRRKQFKLINADVTLIAQQPKLSPYYTKMRTAIAAQMKVHETQINIKAATTEKLGWVGEGKGIAAMVVVLLGK
jgi:2-C-methyl-D-erythritol 2,4-cyclodiphosphate synthase